MADEQPVIDFEVPEGHVLVQNVSCSLDLPFANRRIPPGGLWHMPEAEIAETEQAAGHQRWTRYDPKTAAPVPQTPPVFLSDLPPDEEGDN